MRLLKHNVIKQSSVRIAAALAAVATLASAIPAQRSYATEATQVPQALGYDVRSRVPAVESLAGIGAIGTQSGDEVALPGADKATSALIRVSVFGAKQYSEIFVDGSPALSVQTGHDASQTVLARVEQGKIHISSNAQVDARVETVALFQSNAAAPGATNVVKTPVTRADTAQGLGGDELASEPLPIGVVGQGGVPSEDVRAVYATLTVDANTSGKVTLAGQSFDVPQGRSVVSTVAVPDANGNVNLSADKDLGEARLDVRGWVTGSVQNTSDANVEGSYVPVYGTKWVNTETKNDESNKIAAGKRLDDSAFALALVTAKPSGSRAFVEYGKAVAGRSRGVTVDAATGALAQLDVIDAARDASFVTARGAKVDSSMLLLGDVIGAPSKSDSTVDISWDSPQEGANVYLEKTGKLILEGKVESSAAIEQVKIYGDNNLFGTAEVTYGTDGAYWHFESTVPQTKSYTFRAVGMACGGSEGNASRKLTVHLPDKNATVVGDKTVVLNPDDQSRPVTSVTDTEVVFAAAPQVAPGDVLASGTGEHAPKGFLRKVVSVQRTAQGWVVNTEQAALTDALYQADIDQDQPAFPADGSTVDESDAKLDPSYTDISPDHAPTATLSEAFRQSKSKAKKTAVRTASFRTHSVTGRAVASDENDIKMASVDISCYAGWQYVKNDDKTKMEKQATCGKSAETEKAVLKAVYDAQMSAGASVKFDFSADFGVHLKLAIAYPKFGEKLFMPYVDDFRTYVYADSDAKLDAKAWGAINEKFNNQLASIKGNPVTFYVAGVPVVLTSEMQLGVEGNLNVKAEASMKPHWTHNLKLGVKYDTDGWNQIYQNDLNYKNENNNACTFVKLDGSMTAGIAPWVKPSLYLYDSAGVTETVKLRGQADATFKTTAEGADHAAEATLKLLVIPSLQAGVHLKLPVTDKELLSHDFKEQKQTFTVFDNTKDPWKIGQCPAIEDPGKVTPPETKDVTVTFMDSRSGVSKALGRKAGDTLTLTQTYLERQLGLDSGSLDGIKDLNTAQDGSGKSVKLGSEWTVPDTDTTLYIQYGSDPVPNPTPTKTTVKKVIFNGLSTYAIKSDSSLWAWGQNAYGELGVGNTTEQHSPVKVLDNVTTITTNEFSTFAVKKDNSLWAWGYNDAGQLGTGDTVSRNSPVKIMDSVSTIVADDYSAFAVKRDGTLWAWGRNASGQLGTGDTTSRHNPVKVMDNVATITTDNSSTFAVKKDGTLWAWGKNYGQLGTGDNADYHNPIKIMDNVATITINDSPGSSQYALKMDGSLWAWGMNYRGRLGTGDDADHHIPTKIMDNVDAITTVKDCYSAYAIKKDGSLWAWGENTHGQLGTGDTTDRRSPVKVMDNVTAAAANDNLAYAVKKNGTLWAWGENTHGQLGTGDTTDRRSPVKVMDNVASITATSDHFAYAVKGDSSLWAWGNNSGRLGTGDNTDRHNPVKIMDNVDVITTNGSSTFAVKKDGTLWAWGWNLHGRLGVGDGSDRDSPVKVM